MKTRISLIFLSILFAYSACEETPPPAPIPEPPPKVIFEGYHIGTSAKREYRYVTSYIHVPSMTIRDTFYVKVDTELYSFTDTIEVKKIEGDTLFTVDWYGARDFGIFPPRPDDLFTAEQLRFGLADYQDYDVDLRFSMYGFDTVDTLHASYLFKSKFQTAVMSDVQIDFTFERKEPVD